MINDALPLRFQLRIELQALVNALRRPTSDPLKLIRLAGGCLETLEQVGVDAVGLRPRLDGLKHALAAGAPLDRMEAAALLDRAGRALGPLRAAAAAG